MDILQCRPCLGAAIFLLGELSGIAEATASTSIESTEVAARTFINSNGTFTIGNVTYNLVPIFVLLLLLYLIRLAFLIDGGGGGGSTGYGSSSSSYSSPSSGYGGYNRLSNQQENDGDEGDNDDNNEDVTEGEAAPVVIGGSSNAAGVATPVVVNTSGYVGGPGYSSPTQTFSSTFNNNNNINNAAVVAQRPQGYVSAVPQQQQQQQLSYLAAPLQQQAHQQVGYNGFSREDILKYALADLMKNNNNNIGGVGEELESNFLARSLVVPRSRPNKAA